MTKKKLGERLFEGCRLAVRTVALTGLLLSVFRVAFLVRYAGAETQLRAPDLARALLMGARFDVKVAAILALPLLLLGAIWPAGRGRRVAAVWVGLSTFAVAVAAMVNDGYYGFYHVPIDPIVFGLFEDDTAAVFRSLWEEHHIVLGPAVALALALLAGWWTGRPARRLPAPGARVASCVAVPLLLALAARGRVGGFPLNQKDFTVSTEALLNASVPNGIVALEVAVSDRRMVQIGDDAYEGLRRDGFRRPAEAAAVLGLAPANASDEEVARALFRRTPENPRAAARPPHVVLAIMESWGADLLRYQSPTNDVLGRLAPHLEHGIVFRRFASAHNGTDGSLEALLVNTPISPLLAGEPGHVRFEQAAALPFRAAGYRTAFGMGWSGTWRGIGRSYPNQGFDEVDDIASVLAVVPDAPVGAWGVPDGALFRWAAERLRRADRDGERLLLVLMTASNHSPYGIPAGYAPRPLDPSALDGRSLGDAALRRPQLETYQYACDALGGFLDELRAAGLSDHTVVAATGDHNTRDLFQYPGTRDLPWRDRTPFFLEVPPAYLEGRTVDPDRWAGHRDVFPTLAGLALSGARVFRSGEDLLAPPTRPPRALARFVTLLSDAGVAPQLGAAPACWAPGGELSSDPAEPCRAAVAPLAGEERAWRALLDWEVRRQVIARRHGPGRTVTARTAAP